MDAREAIVIGAGFAGLGTARELRRRGVDAVVLEANDRVAEPWRHRYDSLRLNTIGWQSAAPGRRFRTGVGPFPARDDVVAFLENYVRSERIPVEFGVEATRVDRVDGRWRVRTGDGHRFARAVVVATGFDREPKLPDWPGREGFTGDLIHAAEYRNPEPYKGQDILVVSAGNTGSEVSLELARGGANRVRTAVRNGPNIVSRWVGRIPGNYFGVGLSALPVSVIDRLGRLNQRLEFGDLSEFGIPHPTFGLGTNEFERSVSPLVDDGFIEAVKAGEIEIVGAVESFDGPEVALADGRRIQPDSVIAATGYRRALEALVGHLGVLLPDGRPIQNGRPGPPDARGLWFVGYKTLIHGQLPLTKRDAKRVARTAARRLGRNR